MSQRIDKWLVYARFVKHRARAQALVEDGHVRVNRARIEKSSYTVKPDDVLTLIIGDAIRVVRVRGEAERRGSAPAAQQLYEDLTQKPDAQPALT